MHLFRILTKKYCLSKKKTSIDFKINAYSILIALRIDRNSDLIFFLTNMPNSKPNLELNYLIQRNDWIRLIICHSEIRQFSWDLWKFNLLGLLENWLHLQFINIIVCILAHHKVTCIKLNVMSYKLILPTIHCLH